MNNGEATSGIQRSDKHVFLLGAGFSAPFGLPIMKDFMARARDRYFDLLERDFHNPLVDYYYSMMDFQSSCRKCSWAFNRDWDNIEELYTQADLLRLSRYPDPPKSEGLCKKIAWAIWDVYRHCPSKLPFLQPLFERCCNTGLHPVIITTNYDTICEAAMERPIKAPKKFMYWYPGFELPWPNRKLNLKQDDNSTIDGVLKCIDPQMPPVPVIKLHGSVNWFQYTDGDIPKIFASTQFGIQEQSFPGVDRRNVPIGISDPDFKTKNIEQWARDVCANATDPLPAIIPPMLGKMSISPVISCQWRSAIQCLARAKNITVIGYSFPETDTFMTRLLAEGLKDNIGLNRIRIVDIQSESQWRERINRIFTPILQTSKLKYDTYGRDVSKYSANELPEFWSQ